MLVALIDDGINTSVFNGITLEYDLVVKINGEIEQRKKDETIGTLHGTTCAAIINKYTTDVSFCSLRIFSGNVLTSQCDLLVYALEWCLTHQIPLVHMSLGTANLYDYKKIQPLISKMISHNQVIVAARSNRDVYSIPACLHGVFGVVADSDLREDEYRIRRKSIEIAASSRHILSLSNGASITTEKANSFAAPVITSKIHGMIKDFELRSLSAQQVYHKLNRCRGNIEALKPDFVCKANIINISGMHIEKRFLFFECINEYKSVDEFLKTSKSLEDLVFIPSLDNKLSNEIVK